ncbi:MAG: HIT family protein [Candidatus Dormibacteraceae bacterium]
MQNLHAPWRMEFVGGEKPPGCLFCRVGQAPATQDEEYLVVYRNNQALVLLNRFPYTSGHLLVVPRTHVAALQKMGDETLLALMQLVRTTLRLLEAELHPQAFNVGTNLGEAAGAGIPEHLHFHVVPRWIGDTNFMPVLGQVTVINEHLHTTWQKLREALPKVLAEEGERG